MSSYIVLLALLAAAEPAPVPVSPMSPDTSIAAIPERLLAQRTRLRLNERQVERLRALAGKYRFQENQDRVSSKPWLHRAPIESEARAETMRGLSAEQRRLAGEK